MRVYDPEKTPTGSNGEDYRLPSVDPIADLVEEIRSEPELAEPSRRRLTAEAAPATSGAAALVSLGTCM
jgi:hypothetical protein